MKVNMTIFHVLKYPVDTYMSYEEFDLLPEDVREGYYGWENYNYRTTDNEKLQFIRKLLLEYDGPV